MAGANKWGLDDDYVHAVGKVTIAFSYLEDNVCYTVWAMLGGDRQTADCITAEMSFRNLINLISSLLKQKEKEGIRSTDLAPLLRDAIKKTNAAEQDRNRIVHSRWGFSSKLEAVREKVTAKQKHGLNYDAEPAAVSEIEAVVSRIDEAESAVLDFVRKYVAYYPPV